MKLVRIGVMLVASIWFLSNIIFQNRLTRDDQRECESELKSINNGDLYVKTPYLEIDFNVKWIKIKEIYSTIRFLITLQDGND